MLRGVLPPISLRNKRPTTTPIGIRIYSEGVLYLSFIDVLFLYFNYYFVLFSRAQRNRIFSPSYLDRRPMTPLRDCLQHSASPGLEGRRGGGRGGCRCGCRCGCSPPIILHPGPGHQGPQTIRHQARRQPRHFLLLAMSRGSCTCLCRRSLEVSGAAPSNVYQVHTAVPLLFVTTKPPSRRTVCLERHVFPFDSFLS